MTVAFMAYPKVSGDRGFGMFEIRDGFFEFVVNGQRAGQKTAAVSAGAIFINSFVRCLVKYHGNLTIQGNRTRHTFPFHGHAPKPWPRLVLARWAG